MINWIIDNKEWVFSGIGVFILGAIVGLIKYILSKGKKAKSQRIINLNKSLYVEKNEGRINIE